MRAIVTALALALLLPSTASAQSGADSLAALKDAQRQVVELAFDPARYFDERGSDVLRIRYTGDDHDWPVWSIAVRRACMSQPAPGKRCDWRMIARGVQAPALAEAPRPRIAGGRLVGRVRDHLAGGTGIVAAIDREKPTWVEADLAQCPAATAKLAALAEVRWVEAETFQTDGGPLGVALHADKVDIEIPEFLANARYRGYAREGSPAAWGVEFARALDGCWKPATVPAPWRRVSSTASSATDR